MEGKRTPVSKRTNFIHSIKLLVTLKCSYLHTQTIIWVLSSDRRVASTELHASYILLVDQERPASSKLFIVETSSLNRGTISSFLAYRLQHGIRKDCRRHFLWPTFFRFPDFSLLALSSLNPSSILQPHISHMFFCQA